MGVHVCVAVSGLWALGVLEMHVLPLAPSDWAHAALGLSRHPHCSSLHFLEGGERGHPSWPRLGKGSPCSQHPLSRCLWLQWC